MDVKIIGYFTRRGNTSVQLDHHAQGIRVNVPILIRRDCVFKHPTLLNGCFFYEKQSESEKTNDFSILYSIYLNNLAKMFIFM